MPTMPNMPLTTDPAERNIDVRRQDWHRESDTLESDVSEVKRAADDLLNYVYEIVHEDAPLDYQELRGYVENLRAKGEEITRSAEVLAMVADERRRRARAIMHHVTENFREEDNRIVRDAPRGSWGHHFKVSADHDVWLVSLFEEGKYLARTTEKGYDLADCLRYSSGLFSGDGAWARELADSIVEELLALSIPVES